MSSRVGTIARFVMADVFGSAVRFPLWWYGEGLMDVVRWIVRSLGYRWRGYAIGLWLRHFFVPMYGARDWAGRLVSVVMRAFVILARVVALVAETAASLVLLLVWFFAPVACLLFLLLNLSLGLEALLAWS